MAVDFEKDLVLVTSASGRQCAHLLSSLHQKWKNLRLVCNSATSYQRLSKQYPEADVWQADLGDAHEVRRLFRHVTAVYHVGPPFHPHETEIGYNMVDAAVKENEEGGRVRHFVYSSVLNAQLRKMMNHVGKFYVEEYLMESGLNYTILQPTHFMDTFPLATLMKQDSPVYNASWNPDNAFSFIALQDLGEVGAKVLEERERHYLAQYPLCSTEPLNYREMVSTISKAVGKEIEVKQRSFEAAVSEFLASLCGTDQPHARTRDGVERMLLFYNRRGLVGNPNVCEWLLDRKPTSVKDWAERQARIARERQ